MKKIFLLSILICGFCLCQAQTVQSSQLINTKWKLVSPNTYDNNKTLSFSSTHMLNVVYYKSLNKTLNMNNEYYLSNKVETSFNSNSVGVSKTGKYIIKKLKYRVSCFKIISITSQELKIILIPSKTLIGRPDTLVWKRINRSGIDTHTYPFCYLNTDTRKDK